MIIRIYKVHCVYMVHRVVEVITEIPPEQLKEIEEMAIRADTKVLPSQSKEIQAVRKLLRFAPVKVIVEEVH